MRNVRKDIRVLAAMGLLGTAMSTSTYAYAADNGTADEDAGIAEIIVTAQKREQSLQDVPISITALSEDALKSNRIQSILDLGALVPNVYMVELAGGRRNPSITMRGAQIATTNPGQDAAISYYLDGVWISGASGLVFDLPDLERVEVLRGPQGTLFGRNSTAGAVSLITRNPKGELGVDVKATVGNFDQLRGSIRVDTPSFGPFSASFSYTHSERRGDIRNLGAGASWDRNASTDPAEGIQTSPKYMGSTDADMILIGVKFKPSDNFDLVYKFDHMVDHFTPSGAGAAYWNPGALSNAQATIYNAAYAAHPFPITPRRPSAVNNWFSTNNYQKVQGHNLTMTIVASDSLSFKNILAFRKAEISANQDYGAGGLINPSVGLVTPTTNASGVVGQPLVYFGGSNRGNDKQWSNEFQINYNSRFVTVTAGAIYLHADNAFGAPPGLASTYSNRVFVNGVIPTSFDDRTTGTTKSLAGYMQAEFHLTEQLDATGGFRITNDKKATVSNLRIGGSTSASYNDTDYSLNANVSYKFTPGIMAYARFSRSFVAGGSIGGVDFKPEKVKSIEAGFKGDFFDRRLRLNVALWDAKYTDLQEQISGATFGGAFANVPRVVVTLGNLHAKGFEGELTAVPVNGLTINAGAGYTHYELSNLNPLIGTAATYVLRVRPSWTANMGIQYETQPLFGESTMTFRIDGGWRSKIAGLLRLPVPAALSHLGTINSQLLINGRVAVGNIPVGGGKVEIAGWVKNLTDNKLPAVLTAFSGANPALVSANYTPARTFGLDLSFKF